MSARPGYISAERSPGSWPPRTSTSERQTPPLAMSGDTWAQLYLSQVTPDEVINSGDLKVTSDAVETCLARDYVLTRFG